MGHDVNEAENGQQGYEKAIESTPDIVISDISMPGLSGYELAQKIRSHAPMQNVVLVALTGYGQVADREKAKESGFDYHLVKPVDAKTLAAFLNELNNR
jgi:CheY-like chemotaxis protein